MSLFRHTNSTQNTSAEILVHSPKTGLLRVNPNSKTRKCMVFLKIGNYFFLINTNFSKAQTNVFEKRKPLQIRVIQSLPWHSLTQKPES